MSGHQDTTRTGPSWCIATLEMANRFLRINAPTFSRAQTIAHFLFKKRAREMKSIAFFQSVPGNILVIFDDILKYKTLIKSVIGIGRNDLKVMITARSAIIESSRAAVEHRIGTSYTEIDLNVPVRDELRKLGVYLRENGLLGEYADFSDEELNKFLGIRAAASFEIYS